MLEHSVRGAAWLLTLLLLASGCGWKLAARDAPAAEAPSAGSVLAPSFSLPADDGVFITLDELLADGHPAVLVFYRGHW